MSMPLTIRDRIGANHPPSLIDFAHKAIAAVSDWMKDHPTVETPDDARAAKACIDRARTALDEMERERDALVRPLNQEVSEINGRYKPARTSLEKLTQELKDRLTAYAKALEAARLQALEEARAAKEAAEALARAAEAKEREAFDDAKFGVCGVDLGEATMEADAAFREFERAERTEARAEKETHVRIAGGYGKAMGLRTKETLCVADWKAAIEEIGLTEPLKEAIITAARAYRKAMGELPAGIMSIQERSL
jgi:hypothetical protein